MGMFDYLFINTDKLPVSDEEKKIIGNDTCWQTKDLDCMLTEVYITDEGELKVNKFTYEWDNSKLNCLGSNGVLVRKNEKIETIPYHGSITFYTNIGKYWFEFSAIFIEGKLVNVKKI